MKNVIAVTFTDEKQAYEVLSDLKGRVGPTSAVISAGLVKNENGSIVVKDGYVIGDNDFGYDWAVGGLLGGLIGILGGPLGILFGFSIGGLIGAAIDEDNVDDTQEVLAKFASHLEKDTLTLIALVDEENEAELDSFFRYDDATTITRESFVDVQTEVYQAEEIQDELAKEAKKKAREEKKDKWKAKAEEKQKEIHDKLESHKAKK